MRKCDYCGTVSAGEGKCPGCQSPSFDNEPAETIREGHPFHYNGYVVWWLADWRYDTAEYLFYLGDTLVERFTVSQDVLRVFVPEHCEVMPFIWDLFKVAQGEEEVAWVMEQNAVKPAVFEITRKPTAEEERAMGLTYGDVCEAVAKGERVLGLEHAIEFFK